jgi:hypothetical protein
MNEEIQRLAEELAALDKEADSAIIKLNESRIIEIELAYLKNNNGKAYFPLIKKYNCVIPFDDFYDTFVDVLMGLLRHYDPGKGSFTTALAFQLNHRANDYFEKLNKDGAVISLDERIEELGEAGEVPYDEPGFDDEPDELKTEIRVFVRLAPLIAEQMKVDEHCAKKMWFERFYSFDITKTIKGDIDCAIEAVAENDKLFAIMEIALLEYLMYGSFSNMRDVAENTLKNLDSLKKRNETIQKCYGVSKPTVCARNSAYYEAIRKACIA